MRRAELERFRNYHGDKRVVMMHATAILNILNGKTPAAQLKLSKCALRLCRSLHVREADDL